MYYFVSDMHLGMDGKTSSREREKLLVAWLEKVSADAEGIFLVGDVFDFWFEYKRVVPKGFTRLLGKLSELSDRGVVIHFFAGNHDMWLTDYLEKECGVIIHHKPELLELSGKKVYIAHGDNLWVKPPRAEKIMQWCFRSRFMRRWFSRMVHPNSALRFGHWWSGHSRKTSGAKHVFRGEDEYLIGYARNYLKKNDVDIFIFGHIHCAEIFDLGMNRKAVFLGEWLDRPSFAVMDENGNIETKYV